MTRTPLIIPFLAMLVASAAWSTPLLADAGVRRFALVTGTNAGGPDRERLHYAVDDAKAVNLVLTELGGVSPGDGVLLTDPGRGQLIAALGEVRTRVVAAEADQQRTELVVYYSGHSDETGLLLGTERFLYEELRRVLDNIPADVRVVILDSCSSGSVVRAKGGIIRPSFLLDDSVALSGTAYLTSSAAQEIAQESDTLGASFFTHNLVSGLRGAADLSGDGRVSLSEAYQYVYETTVARTEKTVGGAQHPSWDIRLAGTGDLVMTELTASSTGLLVDEVVVGSITVRDADRRLVAEIQKPLDRRLELGLPPGKYTVLLDRGGHMQEANFMIGGPGMVSLSTLAFTDVHGELARARGTSAYEETGLTLGVVPPFWRRHPPRRVHAALSMGVDAAAAIDGAQLALVGASTRDGARGMQAATAYTYVGGEMDGLQASGGVNVVRGDVRGAQMSTALNVAGGDVRGLQATGGVNVADDVKGAQLGPINVARGHVALQLGIINVADDADVAIGVLSFSRTGYNHVVGYVDVNGSATTGVTFGSKRVYTTVAVGAWAAQDLPWTLELGLGAHLGSDRVYGDIELTAGTVGAGVATLSHGTFITRGRVLVGHAFAPHFALFAGPTVAMEVLGEHQFPDQSWLPTLGVVTDQTEQSVLPVQLGLAVGVRM